MTASVRTIPIAEIFGPTLQGEGALAGQPTYFVRTGGCDFACLWCDSAHAVLAEQVRHLPKMTQEQIFEQLRTLPEGPRWLTISGGNPALHDLYDLVLFWRAQGDDYYVAVETQGTLWKPWLSRVDMLTISPKPPSAGNEDVLKALDAFTEHLPPPRERPLFPKAVLKVVVFDEADYEFAVELHCAYPSWPFYLSVGTAMGGLDGRWVPPAYQPAGLDFDRFDSVRRNNDDTWTLRGRSDTVDSLLRRYRWLADKVKADPLMAEVALFPQLHALIWGIHSRGV